MQFLYTSLVILLASLYVIFLDYLSSSSRALEKALVLPIIILLFAVYRLSKFSAGKKLTFYEKLIFLFWGTVCIQLLIVATGTLYSPFLIFLPLSMIGISFLFTFPIALTFSSFSLVIFFSDIILHQNIVKFFLADPSTVILQLLALAAISPIAYILSYKYHVKDIIFSMLRTKITTDETILESLDELIVVTDDHLRILSVNDAVERVLLQSRSELLYQPLFKVFLLKDKDGILVTDETFFPKGDTSRRPIQSDQTFTIFRSATKKKEVTIQIQPIEDLEDNISQLSFILRYTQQSSTNNETTNTILQKARTKYEAKNEYLKKKVLEKKNTHLARDVFLLENLEADIYNAHLLLDHTGTTNNSYVDVAILCKQMVQREQDFAQTFSVTVRFAIVNFGKKDISPLITKNFTINPEEMTGPFFTVSCDVKKLEFMIKKLLAMSIYIASQEKKPEVYLTVELKKTNMITLQIRASSPVLENEDLRVLFQPYYGRLCTTTGLRIASGLEGFLANKVSTLLETQLQTKYTAHPSPNLTFSLEIKKRVAH